MNRTYFFPLIAIITLVVSCNQGLAPPDKPTGFSGTIYYEHWDSAGTVVNLKLVAFKDYPPEDIVSQVLSGEAKAYPPDLSEPLPVNVDSTFYSFEIGSGYYAYIVIAQQFSSNVFTDWRVVGQYDTTPADSLPTGITVRDEEILTGIDVFVDFTQIPHQPF